MQANTSTQRRRLRKGLLANGYTPLPLAAKGVFIKGWSRAEVDEEWLAEYDRVARYPNTGIRCDNLLAFDIDVLDEDLADACEALVEDRLGPTELCRVGQWPKRLLLYRVDGDPARSGRTGRYGGQLCELLAGHGRQFAAYGTHPGTGEPYEWLEGPDPLSVPWAELPAASAEDALATLEALDALLEDTGLECDRSGHLRGASTQNAYDLLPDTPVEVSGERTTWGEVVGRLTEEGEFGNFYREEYDDWGDSSAVHFYVSRGNGQPCAHDFVNDCTHWESTWEPALAELLPPAPKPAENQFIDPGFIDLAENCVIMRDNTVRRLDDPTRSYPISGFVRSMQHLRIKDPNPPPSNPNKLIPFTKIWETSPDTLKADYAAMRPDRPKDRIFSQGNAKVLNVYRPPEHPEAGGEADTFLEFIEHLLPDAEEQRLFVGWLAHKVTHPSHRMHGMVMVTPTYGTGRGTLVQIMQRLFGIEYVNEVELDDLVGHGGQATYNAYLADSLLVTVGEALIQREDASRWSSRHLAYERLKVVCDPVATKMHIRRKYGTNGSETVYASLFITSNHSDALAIEPGDRRLIVLDNCEVKLVDAPGRLYERIQDWQCDPANIGALHRLLTARRHQYGYDAFGEPPMTAAKKRMIDASQSDTDRLYDAFVDACPADIVTPAQWRQYAHTAKLRADLDLPSGDKLEAALSAVIRRRARRLESLPNGGMLKLDGRPQRPWIVKNFEKWKHCTDKQAIRAEVSRADSASAEILAFAKK